MNIFERLFDVKQEAPPTEQKSAAQYPWERQKFRMHQDLRTFRDAYEQYQNIIVYNREYLHRIYRECMLDPHFNSQWDTRKMKTLEKQFKIVNENGEEQEELTNLLETDWFLSLLHGILNARIWGFSLIEFGPIKNGRPMPYMGSNKKLFPAINELDRDYIKPEYGIIVKETIQIEGIPFMGGQFDNQLLFVMNSGNIHDPGMMISLIKYIMFKDNCLGNWSEWAEVFGMDIRIGKTTAEGDARNKFLNAIKMMGSAGYGVIDPEDELDFVGTKRTDAYKVYNELIQYIDTQISKRIFGQDVITNNTGRVVGTVGENVSNLYGTSDAKFVARVINSQCLEKFTTLKIGNFKGMRFEWDVSEKLNLIDNATIDLQISQMGFNIDPEYIEEKYGTVLSDEPVKVEPSIEKVQEKIKQLYSL